jgi:hypothetical protein
MRIAWHGFGGSVRRFAISAALASKISEVEDRGRGPQRNADGAQRSRLHANDEGLDRRARSTTPER